jgi:hypothetical protein
MRIIYISKAKNAGRINKFLLGYVSMAFAG